MTNKRLFFPEADVLLPNHLTSFLLVKSDISHNSCDIEATLRRIPGAEEVHMTAGSFSFLVKMRTKTKEECERRARKLLLSPQIKEVEALVVPTRFIK